MCSEQTLSPARTRNDAMTCSAVSAVSVASRVMKSRNASNVTLPKLLGSTADMMRWKSASPYMQCADPVFSSSSIDSYSSFK